jgi:lipopolysaccharide/colanic/teichoic acid biosynthesis glycosyltransferase
MSLVGPRMISPPELEMYGEHAAKLLSVKPGMTGLWQVSGRQHISYQERVRLDMWYIENRSLLLDLQILLRTIKCVLQRQGAF